MSSGPLEMRLLLQKYLYNTCSVEELQMFWSLMNEFINDEIVLDELAKLWDNNTLSHDHRDGT